MKRIHIDGCRYNETLNTKRRDLNDSDTLGCSGRNNSKSRSGSSGHSGGKRSGQTRKKPKDLSEREGEDRGCGGVGVCMLCTSVCECGFQRTSSDVTYT